MFVDIYNTDKKYNIIYADPLWHYKVWSKKGEGRSAESHYKTMSQQSIENLGGVVQGIAAENCILLMWVTFPCLLQGLDTLKSWGFDYKTCGFCWIKQNKVSKTPFWGMGYWTRANAEVCLIATKGNIKRASKAVHQVIMSPIEEHSKKPDIVRDKIVELVGDLPRIELFARQHAEGWDCWGDEC